MSTIYVDSCFAIYYHYFILSQVCIIMKRISKAKLGSNTQKMNEGEVLNKEMEPTHVAY